MARKTSRNVSTHKQTTSTILALGILVGIPVIVASCSATSGPSTFESTSQSASSTGGSGGASSSSSGDGGDIGFGGQAQSGGSGGGGINCTPKGPDDDVDGDGYTPNEGDCNDCDKYRNPNAVEVIDDPGKPAFDENCNGVVDEVPNPPCDEALTIDSKDPLDGARAVELCKMSNSVLEWGVVSAAWVMADRKSVV